MKKDLKGTLGLSLIEVLVALLLLSIGFSFAGIVLLQNISLQRKTIEKEKEGFLLFQSFEQKVLRQNVLKSCEETNEESH